MNCTVVRPALFAALLTVAAGFPSAAGGQEKPELPPISEDSGFAWLDGNDDVPAVVARDDVKKGIARFKGHPRDVIPPIDEPVFYPSNDAAQAHLGLRDDDRLLTIEIDGDARAYATRILDRHEVVNDTVAGKHLAIIW